MALQALGRTEEAKHWWLKAIILRPTFFDAIVRLSPDIYGHTSDVALGQSSFCPLRLRSTTPRYEVALEVLGYVLSNTMREDGYIIKLSICIASKVSLHDGQFTSYHRGRQASWNA
jgi:hypothetical protein